MKRLNYKQKILLFCSIIVLCFIGIYAEIDYFNKQDIDLNINQEDQTIINDAVNSINIANKELQVQETDNPTILFGSDYQGDNRYDITKQIFRSIKNSVSPNLFVICGDYQVGKQNRYETEKGINELNGIINHYYDQSIPKVFVQGNHDSVQSKFIAQNGIYESDKYIVYVINRDLFPNNQDVEINSEERVKKTSEVLKNDLQSIVDRGIKKPILIATHVPLHYSIRNNGYDNAYAHYIVDVLNDYGSKLDIVYLFGHNHSSNYDDYIGGSINYIASGSIINVGGTNEQKEINFTYMNAGYIGNTYNKTNDHSVNLASMSTITINNENLLVQKYTKYGQYYSNPIIVNLKNK